MFKAMFSYKKGRDSYNIKAKDFQVQVLLEKNNTESVLVTAPKPFSVEISKQGSKIPEVIKAQSLLPRE